MRTVRVIATTVAAMLLSATLTPAHADDTPPTDPTLAADCQFSGAKVNPSTVIVGITNEKTVKITASATGCESYDWGVVSFGAYQSGDLAPANANHTTWTGFAELDPYFMVNSDAGKDWGQVTISDDGETRDLGASLTVKRRTTLDTSAPSKVKKNKWFYIDAVLMKANWSEGYYDVAHGKLRLQSRPSGGKWKTIKTLDTAHGGREGGGVYYDLKIKKYTCYRWLYAGSLTAAPVTSDTDCVKIKK